MFLIISSAFFLDFLTNSRLVCHLSPHFVSMCCFLLVSKFCLRSCWRLMGATSAVFVWPAVVVVVVVFFIIRVGWKFFSWFFVRVLELPPVLLAPPPSVVFTAANTLRLHISACRSKIWSSCCLSCVVKFVSVVVSSVNRNEGGRIDGGWEIDFKQAEHGRALHCNATASGPMRGS